MSFTLWSIIIGVVLISMALTGSVVKRLPLSSSTLYLLIGFGLGPIGWGLIHLDPVRQAALLEHVTEVAVIVSLFTAGLKLRVPLSNARWGLPLRLAFGSMALTVGLLTLVGVYGLGLPWGAAVLLGTILAPTDPVLAADVQVERPEDYDRLRFSLTGEAGLNDGTAFPFLMLGLGLLGLHPIGEAGWRWVAVDVAWAIPGGLAIGALLGTLVGHLVLYLRREHREAVGLDDFLALGLIALSYGLALLAHTYGFLAVFAAGLALRRTERRLTGEQATEDVRAVSDIPEEELATDREKAPAYMAQAVLTFNEQIERIGEVAVVLMVGGMLTLRYLPTEALWFVPLLFLVVRPLSVWLALLGSRTTAMQRGLIAWFGIRGIGSIYYLAFAITHGLPEPHAQRLTALALTTVAASVMLHGISVTPLMTWYERRGRKRSKAAS